MANERVLIVSNSAQDAEFLVETVLEPNHYQVLVAHNDEAGLTLAQNHHPDLVLLDADASGLVLLDTLVAQNIDIPAVVTLSENTGISAIYAFKAGVKDCLVKPYTAANMLKAIERALAESRLRKEQENFNQHLAKANQSLEQRLKELNTLFGIGKSVTSWLDPDKLLPRLVEAAIYLTNAESGSLLLVDDKTGELYIAAARGLDDRIARSFRLPIQGSLAGEVALSGQPIILTEDETAKTNIGYPVKSVIYAPLKVKEHVLGVLSADNRHQRQDFTNNDLRMLSALADYASVFLENARLFNQAENAQAQLLAVLGRLEDPVVIVSDQDDEIIETNPIFCRLFGVDENDIKGQPLTGLIQNNDLFDFTPAALDASNNQKSEIVLNDGRIFQVTVTQVLNVGRAIIMRDITYFKKMEQMKSEFVSTVSRDIRAPLDSIKEYATMFGLAGELNQKQQLFADRIVAGVERVTTLVDNLLDFSTIQAGLDTDKKVVDIGQLTTEVLANFQHQAGRKHQQLIGHITGEPIPVSGNKKRLQQVIAHLIDNAVKHTPAGGQISTIVQTENNQVIFKVEDNGPGVPPADLPFIFDKFFRVNNNNNQIEAGGSGLGLALCKSIVENHGGHIWAENRLKEGCVFTFTLPLTPLTQTNSVNARSLNTKAMAMQGQS